MLVVFVYLGVVVLPSVKKHRRSEACLIELKRLSIQHPILNIQYPSKNDFACPPLLRKH